MSSTPSKEVSKQVKIRIVKNNKTSDDCLVAGYMLVRLVHSCKFTGALHEIKSNLGTQFSHIARMIESVVCITGDLDFADRSPLVLGVSCRVFVNHFTWHRLHNDLIQLHEKDLWRRISTHVDAWLQHGFRLSWRLNRRSSLWVPQEQEKLKLAHRKMYSVRENGKICTDLQRNLKHPNKDVLTVCFSPSSSNSSWLVGFFLEVTAQKPTRAAITKQNARIDKATGITASFDRVALGGFRGVGLMWIILSTYRSPSFSGTAGTGGIRGGGLGVGFRTGGGLFKLGGGAGGSGGGVGGLCCGGVG